MTRAPVVTTFIPALVGGGAERTVVNVAEALARAGLRHRLVMLEPHVRAADGMQFTVPEGTDVHLLAPPLRRSLPALARYLRRNPPDVLVAHVARHNVMAALGRRLSGRRFPLVLVEHSTPSAEFGGGGLEDWLIRRLMQATYPSAEVLGAVCDTAARDLARFVGVGSGRVQTLYNPVVPSDLDRLAAQPSGHPWLDAGGPVVLGVGRLAAEKNWPYLVRSLVYLRRAEPRARLVLLGTGPEEASIREEAARHDLTEVVDLAGFVPNPYAFMRRASVVALASRYEGLPSVLVEALACRAAVVATASTDGVREALAGGVFGTIAPPDDERAYAGALLAAIRHGADPRAAWWATEQFGVDQAAARYATLLSKLAGHEPAAIAEPPDSNYAESVGGRHLHAVRTP